MTALLTTEVRKLRTVGLPRAALLIVAVGSALIGVVGTRAEVDAHHRVVLTDLVTAPVRVTWFVVLVVAVVATAGEFRHRTIVGTMLQTPVRGRVLAAKAAVAAAYGALLTTLAVATCVAAGAITMHQDGRPLHATAAALGAAAGSVVIGALWGVLATGVGTAVRSTTVAVVAVLVWQLVLESAVPAMTGDPGVIRWLPGGASSAAVSLGDAHVLLHPAGGAAVFCGYAAAALAAGWLLLVRRDPV
jgi:ABC-2 type transport system permease protein